MKRNWQEVAIVESSDADSISRPRLAWLINACVLLLAVLIVALAFAETGWALSVWTVLLSLGGISVLLVTGILVVAWLRGHGSSRVPRTVEHIDS